jgi:3-deoxy-D-manno-octulosonic-acid transferase
MARAATDAVNAIGGAVERTMQAIEPFVVQVTVADRR